MFDARPERILRSRLSGTVYFKDRLYKRGSHGSKFMAMLAALQPQVVQMDSKNVILNQTLLCEY